MGFLKEALKRKDGQAQSTSMYYPIREDLLEV